MLLNINTELASKATAEKSGEELKEILGVLTEKISGEKLSELFSNKAERVVVSLANADADKMLAVLFHENANEVLTGALAAAKITNAEKIVFILPDGDKNEELQKAIDKSEICEKTEIRYGFCKKGEYKNDIILHPLTCVKICALLSDESADFCVVSADGKEPIKVPYETKIGELVNPSKGLRIGNSLFGLDVLDKEIGTQIDEENGVFESLSDKNCAVNAAERIIHQMRSMSCGRCVFCREGLVQIDSALIDMMNGKGKPTDLSLMAEIAEVMESESNCSLGRCGAKSIKALGGDFESEAKEHLSGRCSAKECLGLVHYYIDPKLCKGDGACAEICPKNAIEGGKGYISVVDEFECVKCGKCLDVCAHGAVKSVSGRLPKLPDEPIAIGGAKKFEEGASRKERKRVRPSARLYSKKLSGKSAENDIAKEAKITVKGNLPMREMNADIIIVAAGPAGLAAAVTAGENNLSCIVIEKSNTTGGAANMGMGPLGIDTKVQRRQFNQITVEKAFDLHMDYTHWRVDADLVSTYFAKSGDTIEWLEGMGVEFAGAFKYFAESEATWHIVKPENGVIGPRAAGGMVKALTNRAKELGAQFEMETTVTELIKEDGKVCGVMAVDKEGQQIKAMGKAVIVATGGFGNNKEMLEKEFNLHLCEDFYPFMVPGITGDGLNMMWKAGAMKYGAGIEAIFQLPDNLNWFLLDAVLRQPNLLVNQLGERFMNEDRMGNTTFTGNALALQPGNYGYCIMDGNILKYYKKNGPDIEDIVHPAEAFHAFEQQAAVATEQGYEAYFEAETIEELAEKLQIDEEVLRNTIDTYNEMCDMHCDTQFNKNPKFLHKITGKGKYLVGKFYLGAYGTIGGVRINKYCEVLDDDFMPIPGLYSAGSDANTIYGDSYNFTLPGNTMGFAVNSGRMAGEAAAEYINGEN